MHIYKDVYNKMLLTHQHINKCENISNHSNKNNIIEFIIKKTHFQCRMNIVFCWKKMVNNIHIELT